MKRIKIMLTALTVFAIVGGALAFKAKSPIRIFCSDTPASGVGVVCPTFTDSYTFTTINPLDDVFCGTLQTSCDQNVKTEL